MAGVGIRATIDDLQLQKTLQDLLARAQDVTRPLTAAGIHMLRSVQLNFSRGGRPEPWAPDRPATVKAKGSTKPLIDTGRLMSSITMAVSGRRLAVSSNLVYARIHQLGGHFSIIKTRREVKIPARPYLLFQEEDLPIIQDILADYFAQAGRG